MNGRRVLRQRTVALAAVLSALLLAQAGVVVTRSTPAATASTRVRLVGHVDGGMQVRFGLSLRTRQAALQRFLHRATSTRGVQTARLSARQQGDRFGLGRPALAGLEASLRRLGLRVVATYPQRTWLQVEGPAAIVERVFETRLGRYVDIDGHGFHAPQGEPVVPAELRSAVTAVTGLSTRSHAAPSDIPTDGMKPSDLSTTYDIKPVWDAGYHGEGQTVAVFSSGSFNDADPAGFASAFGITGPAPQHVPVNGGSTDTTSEVVGEVNLDLDTIRSVAPQVQVLNYEIRAPQSGSGFVQNITAVVNQVVADGRADILSISYGLCDVPAIGGQQMIPDADRAAAEAAFQSAAARGITILVASGDGAAYTCQHFLPSDLRVTAAWPGDSPWVLSVGGTFLSVREDGTYLEEAGWEDPITRWGTGGGLNPTDARPDWQKAPGVDNQASNGKRQFPDVSATGDLDTGYQVYMNGRLFRVGGTSGSTPFWAGVLILIRQAAQTEGVNGGLGFVPPLLYQLASGSEPFPPFHDVTKGGNLFYPCTPGWDYATGLGTPDVFNLTRDLVALVKAGR